MDVAAAVATSQATQGALSVINAVLQIFASLWLPGACVEDKAIYDYIVVGAGTSGAVVANRLSENKDLRILLLEAGGDPPFESIIPGLVPYVMITKEVINSYATVPNDYTLECKKNKMFHVGSGKVLGGTSSINNMIYERGNPKDFSRWAAAAGDPSWEWAGVLPYFKKSENLQDPAIKNSPFSHYHGYDGPMIVTGENRPEINDYLNAFAEIGNDVVLDLNGDISVGYTAAKYTIGAQRRQGTAQAFLAPKDDIANLDILKYTEAQRILFDDNKNAIGVVAISKNNTTKTFMSRHGVIICAGAINSAKLLMLSGIGPREHLENNNITVLSALPVGENYHDHVNVRVVHKLGKACKPVRPYDIHLFPYPTILGYVSLNISNTYPDYVVDNYIISSDKVADDVLRSCTILNGFNDNICETLFREVKGRKILNSYIKMTQPRSRGKVMLRSSDPSDPPIIDTGIFSDEYDLNKYTEILRDFLKIGQSQYFKDQNAEFVDPTSSACEEFEYDSDDYWRCFTRCLMIPKGEAVGTCSLGSVVDSRLRVKGVNKLWVTDQSIIAHIPVSTVYASTVMIGEKAADMILQDMK